MSDEFTSQEKEVLSRFVTNTDKPIFALINLPESVKGSLFSRYSRSTKSLRRLLLDEFIQEKESGFNDIVGTNMQTGDTMAKATQKAEDFYTRILDGYGDDSVGELGGAHIACEDVSNIAAKALEDPRIGASPLEKSTRYVYFDQKDANGEYRYYREPTIMGSEFEKEYIEVNNLLFDTYSQFIPIITDYVKSFFSLESFEFPDPITRQPVKYTQLTDEKLIKRAEIAYKSAVRAKSADVVRYLLPASTKTNVGIFGNGRFYQNMLVKFYSDPLKEMQDLGASMHNELNYVIKPFVKRAKADDYVSRVPLDMQQLSNQLLSDVPSQSTTTVNLMGYDPDAENNVIALMLYPYSNLSLAQLHHHTRTLSPEQKKQVIQTYMGTRRHRRDKPSRALEQTFYDFDILADFGAYRDLQRHRVLTQMRQDLTPIHGYETPEEILDIGLKKEYDYAMRAAAELYHKIHARFPKEAQYVIPNAYRVRWYMKMNLREAFHFIELRSGIQGHPSYRRIAQLLHQEIARVHPAFGNHMKFVDHTPSQTSTHITQKPISGLYALSRFQSEMKKEEKKEAREVKKETPQ